MDLDTLYSENPISAWETVLGPDMHYHYRGKDVLEEILEYIPENSKILDCGCGWGGTGRFLKERGHDVTGVTICKAQADYIKDFPVIHADLHEFTPPEHYDVAVMMECCFHLTNPRKVFDNIVPYAKHLIIIDVVLSEIREVPEFLMQLAPKEYIFGQLWKVGYVVQKYREHLDYYKKTQQEWLDGINKLPAEEIHGHIAKLKTLCELGKVMDTEGDPRQIIIHAKRR